MEADSLQEDNQETTFPDDWLVQMNDHRLAWQWLDYLIDKCLLTQLSLMIKTEANLETQTVLYCW